MLDGLIRHYKFVHGGTVCWNVDQPFACSNDDCENTFETLLELEKHEVSGGTKIDRLLNMDVP